MFLPLLAVGIRRMKDTGRSGWCVSQLLTLCSRFLLVSLETINMVLLHYLPNRLSL
ncbi:MAG: DUF805 domain-containing protein [Candidatus Poribacteria bacterium]|nr:DUF805 domain-containing protein [Candidatus Poribacteria bacterium]MDP6748956.1 DUF805 domain-containing protein [Candidatus Poribacteria bacterium]MDP6997572.1 DUF805 domain-containing protein [Candidatus Poribacteria bacterium]